MGKATLKDRILGWYWTQMRKIMNYTLKYYGYDFGEYFMEGIEEAYVAYKKPLQTNE